MPPPPPDKPGSPGAPSSPGAPDNRPPRIRRVSAMAAIWLPGRLDPAVVIFSRHALVRPAVPRERNVNADAPRREHGFTLIELLVVISIVALLVSILLPALAGAREAGRRVQCLSTQRQMALATSAYHLDYDGYFPIALIGMWDAGPAYGWDFTVLPDGTYRPGTIWAAAGAPLDIQQCPSMDGDANWAGDPYTGYNYNTSYLGGPTEPLGGWAGAGTTMPPTANIGEITTPARCAVFGDGAYGSGANKFMRSPRQGPRDTDIGGDATATRGAGAQAFIHMTNTNAAFADGHAASFDTPYRDVHPNVRSVLADNAGFLSSDNDLYDLR